VITPEQSMWMAGYGKRDEPSSGVAQDLHAKAVAIEDEDRKTVVLVSAKLLGITPDLRDDVLAACESEYDLDPDEVLLNVSHTHNGPEYRTDNYGILGFDDELTERSRAYRARLEDELVDVIGAALEDRCSAVLRYSHASCGMAMSRRLPAPDGIDFSPYPEGVVDHDVPVLVAISGGDITTILLGYACHPTSPPLTNEFYGD